MQQQKIEKAHIGGYSMGGGVTLSLLATNPEKFITASFQGSGIGETSEWRDKLPKDKEGTDPEADKARQLYEAARAARGESARGEAVGNNRADIARVTQNQNAAAGDTEAAQTRARERQAMMEALDLTKIKFPVMAINGEFDRPIGKTHRMWRQLDNFTNLVLPGKGHLSAVMEGLIPPQRNTVSIAAADGLERLGSKGTGCQCRCGIAEQIEVHGARFSTQGGN